jgi:hypothetical protein
MAAIPGIIIARDAAKNSLAMSDITCKHDASDGGENKPEKIRDLKVSCVAHPLLWSKL